MRDGWYGPDGGGHANMTSEEWGGSSGALNGNGWITMQFLTTICCATVRKKPTQWKLDAEWNWTKRCRRVSTGVISPWLLRSTVPTPIHRLRLDHWHHRPSQAVFDEQVEVAGFKHSLTAPNTPSYIPGGYIYSPHNGGIWNQRSRLLDALPRWKLGRTDHTIFGKTSNGLAVRQPEIGYLAIAKMSETKTMGYSSLQGQFGWMTRRKPLAMIWQIVGLHGWFVWLGTSVWPSRLSLHFWMVSGYMLCKWMKTRIRLVYPPLYVTDDKVPLLASSTLNVTTLSNKQVFVP